MRVAFVDPFQSTVDYSFFILKKLKHYIKTSHLLIVHWDGFIINPACWKDDFLCYDYLGAIWPQKGGRGIVGNGGFSLRSMKLLEALQSEMVNIACCIESSPFTIYPRVASVNTST